MYLTVTQQLNHLSKKDYVALRALSHAAKNLYNEALYSIRQHFFDTGEYLSYCDNYKLMKNSENYRILNSNIAQQILREVDGSFRSFFGLLKLKNKGEYNERVRIPHYLDKDGYTTLVIGFVRISRDNKLVIPYSNRFRRKHNPVTVNIPPILTDKRIKEVRIIPRCDCRFFEIQYTYIAENTQRNTDNTKALAIDLGVGNLVTAVSSEGRSFIIDGKKLKSVNQFYNKQYSRFQSAKDKQNYGKKLTKRQSIITRKRNNRVNDYLSKSARKVIEYCIENDIGILVAGYSPDFQKGSHIGRENNQSFVNIPFGRLIRKLEYLCELNGIEMIRQEESYTSQASFFDRDDIPVYRRYDNTEYCFSGKRIKRGLYKTSDGTLVNADVNGALNIMRKSSVVDVSILYSRGEVDTPVRIRVA